jgi:hypothetical protein
MDHTIVPFSHAIPIFVSFPHTVYSNLEPPPSHTSPLSLFCPLSARFSGNGFSVGTFSRLSDELGSSINNEATILGASDC